MKSIIVVLAAATAWAQSGNSTVSGEVKDVTMAAVPNAKVVIVSAETGVKSETVTNDAGVYRVGNLVPGRR